MIIFPGGDYFFQLRPDRFYVNKELCLRNGLKPVNIFDNPGFNDLSLKGWARYSFHLHGWSPTRDVISGTMIYDVTEAIYNGLSKFKVTT